MSARDVARAIDALRRGWPIAIRGAGDPVGLLAIETADAGRMKAFDP
jgi:GTP cyclohydrolase II